jgi:hypothetical protein
MEPAVYRSSGFPAAVVGEECGGLHARTADIKARLAQESISSQGNNCRQVAEPGPSMGRDNELVVLRAAVEALGRGEGTVVSVKGEPGIGKSAFGGRPVRGCPDGAGSR